MKKAELLTKYIELVKKYGENNELHTFEICANKGLYLAGSTIDKIEVVGDRWVYLYYNENINDYDGFNMFLVRDLQKFYNGLKQYVKDYIPA